MYNINKLIKFKEDLFLFLFLNCSFDLNYFKNLNIIFEFIIKLLIDIERLEQ